MQDQFVVAFVYFVVGLVVLPIILSGFKSQYDWLDIVLTSGAAAVASLIPTVGGPVSFAVMIGVLHLRTKAEIFPDVMLAVIVARLMMMPALMVLGT